MSPSSFYSSEVKVYTGKDLPPVVIGVGGGGGQEENATPGPHFRHSKPSAVIQQVSYDQACKLKIRLLESSFPVSVVYRPATWPSKQTVEATAEQKQEVSSLNLNLSLQA